MFQINNPNGTNGAGLPIFVQPLSWNPAVLFRRARLICARQVVEHIDDFNRLSLMLTDLLPEDDQHDVACEGFGNFDCVKPADGDDRKGYRQADYDVSGNVNSARRVMFVVVDDRLDRLDYLFHGCSLHRGLLFLLSKQAFI